MKSEPRGKSTARDLVYIPYVNDGLDLEIQMNYLIDFSWQIFDENLYVIATGDIFPISMLKDAVGDTAKINITRYYKTPVSNIPEAEIPPSELIPGIIEKVNEAKTQALMYKGTLDASNTTESTPLTLNLA